MQQFDILTDSWMNGADGRVRTCAGTKPHGPKPCPFGHSGTSANIKSLVIIFYIII
jgi:hypothetical protein